MTHASRAPWLIRAASVAATFLRWSAAAILLAWLIGRVLTDRYHWSQWLWWIPTPTILLVILPGIIGSLRRTARPRLRSRRIRRWLAAAAVLFLYFALFEHRLLHRSPPVPPSDAGLKVMHWNAQPPTWADMDACVDFITAVNADITILTNPSSLLEHDRCKSWVEGQHVMGYWPFAVASRYPILAVRPLISVDRMYVVRVEFDTKAILGRSLSVYLVDMPSNPMVGRMATARRVRGMLDELKAPPADLAIGDFNISRGSASIAAMFPAMRYAYDESGHGYGATYHRRWPLQHLDHVLLDPSMQSRRYDILDPGRGRHRAQVTWVANIK